MAGRHTRKAMLIAVTLLSALFLFHLGVGVYVDKKPEVSFTAVSGHHEHLYFAYGANMSIKYLTNIRNVRPLARSGGSLSGYELTFGVKGVNALEPGFANIRAHDGAVVEGVVYALAEADFTRIVGSEPDEYGVKTVPVMLRTGETVHARVLMAAEEGGFQPSRRYLQIMVDGATEAELSPEYVARLESNRAVHKGFLSEIMGTVIYTFVFLQSYF